MSLEPAAFGAAFERLAGAPTASHIQQFLNVPGRALASPPRENGVRPEQVTATRSELSR